MVVLAARQHHMWLVVLAARQHHIWSANMKRLMKENAMRDILDTPRVKMGSGR